MGVLFLTGMTASVDLTTIGKALENGLSSDSCLNYCITGVCTFIQCTPAGCNLSFSPQIEHRSPDLIVVARNGDYYPFPYTKKLADLLKRSKLQDEISAGATTSSKRNRASSLFFSEVEIIGQPIDIADLAPDLLCNATTKALLPYYLSAVDSWAWRSGIPDLLGLLAGKFSSLNTGNTGFGHLWPRKGFSLNTSIADHARLSVLRAYSIIEDGGWNIGVRIPRAKGDTTRLQYTAKQLESAQCWQQIAPVISKDCHSLSEMRTESSGNEAWLLWSNYQCCTRNPGKLIHQSKVAKSGKICL